VNRRDLLILGAGTAIARPLIARAQQQAMPVVGFLTAISNPAAMPYVAEFRQGLSEAGYVEGQNVAIEFRWAEGHYDRLPGLAADLVGRRVAVIVAFTVPPALAAKAATATIPIVFWSGGDPVEQGLVASLARPGGNLTGFALINDELGAKRLELLRELVPKAAVFGLLVNPANPVTEPQVRDAQEAARAMGVQIHILNASTESEIETAFATMVEHRTDALMVGSDLFLFSHREQLFALAARHAVPAIYTIRDYARAGGLMSYAGSREGSNRLLGRYAGRILKGEKPADLPVQQPTKFELVINMKTAQALSLTVPQTLLARADEVIE
jgi:putative ABC transport system substrate-binding protein